MSSRTQMAFWLSTLLASGSAAAATFTVTSTAASGAGSLTNAITQANSTAGTDTINFGIAGTGVKVLTVPGAGYPLINEAVLIDGYTQAGAVANSAASGSTNAVLRVEINASNMSTTEAVFELSAPTTLRGLAINNLPGQADAVSVDTGGSGSSIRGCFFGTNAAGIASGGGDGIDVGAMTQIGSSAPADRNLFAGLGAAAFVSGAGTVIQGNLFGTFADGTSGGNQGLGQGVVVRSGATTLSIGGTAAGQGNVFRDINQIGVRLVNAATAPAGVSILGNSIDGIAGVPIDLGSDGVDPIDPGDADTGPNGRENTVVLLSARRHGTQLLLQGTLDGNFTSGTKRLELFTSPAAHPSGSGAGAVFLGSAGINPGGVNVAFLDLSLTIATLPSLTLPQVITATVTNADGSTSEFSNAVDLIEGGGLLIVTNVNDSGTGSLRQQLTNANNNAGPDAIIFNISGAGPHTISPATALPSNTGPLVIDGYTETGARPNTAAVGSNAIVQIVLDGSAAGAGNLLTASAGTLELRGLNLRNSAGVGLLLSGGSAHRIEGCFVGTDNAGISDQGHQLSGISVSTGVNGVRIGGPGLHQRNLISGNNGAGVSLSGDNWVVENNVIGTAADGTTGLGNSANGVAAAGSGGRVVGNRIRGNLQRGIGLSAQAVQVDIDGNGIFGNSGLGIDLLNDGLTANDVNDADSGPNGLQNFPVLSSVTSLANGSLRVAGSLDRPTIGNHTFRFDVFRSASCDGTHGEGEVFLGAGTRSFVAGTTESFTFDLSGVSVPEGTVITATATTAGGDTSEFSACISSVVQTDAIFANGYE